MKLGDTIYYCKKVKGKVEEYEAPIPITLRFNYFTLMPASEYNDVAVYGEDIVSRYRAMANFSIWGLKFDVGDKFYIDYAKPDNNEEYGKTANAEITAVLYQNLFVRLEIKKLTQQNER